MAGVYERCDIEIRPGRRLIGRIKDVAPPVKRRARGNMWADNVCKAISIAPEQATPERVAKENAEAKRHGTGAVYGKDGQCHLPTRGSRARELRRLGKQDNDAGYSDFGGR